MLALPSSTPAEKPYTNLVNSTQYARNNFRPTKREWRRTVSPQETPSALSRNLKHYWGYQDFRHPQLEICSDALRGCDIIVVAPTGLGKSLCFQLPAITIEHGVTIVVSPLKALMADQVQYLVSRGIKAVQLSEHSSYAEHNEVRRQMKMGHPEIRLLYVTPEMLLSDKHKSTFDTAYKQKQIARLVVDEAHVITEWGTSFRGKYRELGKFRERYYDIPITALTASATKHVRDDIIQTLRIRKGYGQWVMPFNRRNLFYEVRYQGRGSVDDEEEERPKSALEDIGDFISSYRPQARARNITNDIHRPCVTGIIYCRTTAACEEVAEALRQRGIIAMPFYRNLNQTVKDEALAGWKVGSIECIVATIAFGMGIDHANVRYVIHYQMPKTFEGYYQETGRAGRDGHVSHCLMYYSREDAKYLRSLVEQEDAKQRRRNKQGDANITVPSQGLNSFKNLQNFIENIGQCRHIGVCSYFGEKIDGKDPEVKAAYCENMCDICKSNTQVRKSAMRLSDDVPIASLATDQDAASRTSLSRDPMIDFWKDGEDTETDEPVINELLNLHGPEANIFESDNDPPNPLRTSPNAGAIKWNKPCAPIISLQKRTRTPSNDTLVPATSSNPRPSFTSTSSTFTPPTIPPSRTPVLYRDISSERIMQPIRVREIIHYEMGGEPPPSSLSKKKQKIRNGSALSSSPTSSKELDELEKEREKEKENIRQQRQANECGAGPGPQTMANRANASIEDHTYDGASGTEWRLTKEQRVKAERMLDSVAPVTGSGLYTFYNAAPPVARFRKVSAAGDKTFKPPILRSPKKVRSDLLTKVARNQAVADLSTALNDSLAHGELAKKILRYWGRIERGSKRKSILIDVARCIERDVADTHRENPAFYSERLADIRRSTKALRSAEVVEAIAEGEIDTFDDGGPAVDCLKMVGRYLKDWKGAQ